MAEVRFNNTSACSDSSAKHKLCVNQRLQQPDLAARRGAGGACMEGAPSCVPAGDAASSTGVQLGAGLCRALGAHCVGTD